VSYDGTIAIARGTSRKETKWKNGTIAWSALLGRLAQTTRTPESQAEYFALDKARQDEIKDVGGFVGGTLAGGRRKADSVSFRQLVTLDADFAKPGLVNEVFMLADYAVAVYSTHKHTPERPRLRFLFPLSRPATPDEYKAVSRRLAADIGINYFDDTTYDPSRLMYWPSTSRDAEYVFDFVDGPWVDVDGVLATYDDWRDASLWPTSERAKADRQKLADKQGDPLAKPGLVGAFCRAYSIEDAIEAFLPEVYEAAGDGRYTYTKGSTVGGLVIYEGRFAYSHHGTDPASERLLNAFDLVRVHLYGKQDADAPASAPTTKLPSYQAMLQFCSEDPQVKGALGAERMAAALAEFGELPDDAELKDEKWTEKLETDRSGRYRETIHNVVLILENDPRLAGRIGFNSFSMRPTVIGPLPWNGRPGSPWTDADDAGLRHYIERVYKISAVGKVSDALAVVLERHQFHPVRAYLDGLVWDEVPRLDRLLIDYLGAADIPYVRAVTRKALCAAVARVRVPGIKYDTMLVLVGPQGIGKSQIIDRLGRGWYSDSLTTVIGKEAYEQLQGAWLIEMGELSALKKAEVESVKHFISKREDIFRVAYGRHTGTFPRQCVFFGTTNTDDFMRDATGGRRFWPVDVHPDSAARDLWTELDPAMVDQIWAEAVVLYDRGEPLHLEGEVAKAALEHQRAHTEETVRAGLVREFLDKPIPVAWYEMEPCDRRDWLNGYSGGDDPCLQPRDRVCVLELWVDALGGDVRQLTPLVARELHYIMQTMPGWTRHKKGEGKLKFGAYGTQRAYVRE
jgi:predicted P-loop ATPase